MENTKNSKLKLIAIILVLVVLIILVQLLGDAKKDDVWDYSKITSVEDIISEGIYISDRKIYYELEDIIAKFLVTNNASILSDISSYDMKYTADASDYYNIITKDYKRAISKSDFTKKVQSFSNEFLVKNQSEIEGNVSINTKSILGGIIKYSGNKYLCILKGNTKIEYLGIVLDTSNKSYSIFYIE